MSSVGYDGVGDPRLPASPCAHVVDDVPHAVELSVDEEEQCLKPVDQEGGRTLPVILRLSSKTGAPTPVGKVRPVLTVVPGADGADDPRRGRRRR